MSAPIEKLTKAMSDKHVAAALGRFGEGMIHMAQTGFMEKLDRVLGSITQILDSPFVVAIEQITGYLTASTSEATSKAIVRITEFLASDDAQRGIDTVGGLLSKIIDNAEKFDQIGNKLGRFYDIIDRIKEIF
jgi:hypothetical protein